MHLKYPSDLPYDDIMVIVTGIKNGTLAADMQRGGKALWELSGFALLQTLGEPSDTLNPTPTPTPAIHTFKSPRSDEQLNDDQVCEFLTTYAEAQRDNNPDVVQAQAIPWKSILQWAIKILSGIVLAQ